MTRLQLESRHEQMEAHRRDFSIYWKRKAAEEYSEWTPQGLAMVELAEWKLWLAAAKTKAQQQHNDP